MLRPQAGGNGWQHHESDGHECAEGLKAGYEVHDDQDEKEDVPKPAFAADGFEKQGVDAFEYERAVDDGKGKQCEGGYGGDELQGGDVDGKYGAEKQMQQIDAAAVFADEDYAYGEAAQVEGGKVGIFFQGGEAADESGKQCHQHACGYAAQTHGGQAQAGKHVADGGTGQDGVAQCVAYQAHTAHDEEYADGCGTEGQAEDGCEGVAHEVEFCKGGKEQVVEVHGFSVSDGIYDAHQSGLSCCCILALAWAR